MRYVLPNPNYRLAIENRELRDQTQGCLATVDHQDIAGDLVNFLDQLESKRPDVVLIDISAWKDPLQGLVASIGKAVGNPMIVALHNAANTQTILAALRAGVHEFLFPPCKSRCAERSKGVPLTAPGYVFE